MKLNVGCGRDYREGYVNIDISRDVRAEHYLDIRKDPLPFPDQSVKEIYISGVLEQIGNNDEFLFCMQELGRVLEPGGTMRVIVPNAAFAIAHQDPMDVRKFTKPTFFYFLKGDRHHDLYGSVYGFPGFSALRIEENDRHILTVDLTK